MKKLEYLDQNVKIFQDDDFYTFTSDSILLSRFATVKNNDVVADFCAGCGVVGFNLYTLNREKISSLTFFELQSPLFNLCKENIALNGLEDKFAAVLGKIQDLPKEYYGKFSLIVCNPPYMKNGAGDKNLSETIATARSETALSLRELIFAVSRGLKFGGRVNLVHRADRTAEIFSIMKEFNIEPKKLCPVAAKDKDPYLVLIEGVKGGKSGLKFLKTIYN